MRLGRGARRRRPEGEGPGPRQGARRCEAPFTGEPAEFAKTEFRFGGLSWTEKGVADAHASPTARRASRARGSSTRRAPRRASSGSASSRTATPIPGRPDDAPGQAAPSCRSATPSTSPATGASPLGDRPFLDRLNLKTLATERVFQTDDKSYETVAALLSDDAKRLLTRWETKTDFPNYYVRDLAAGTKTRPDPVQGPGAAAHGHPEAARDLRPQGRREAVGHGLPAAGLQARHAAAVRAVGLPGRVHRRGHRQPGVGLAEPLHDDLAAPRTCSSSPRATA